jgi:hypothetical protein
MDVDPFDRAAEQISSLKAQDLDAWRTARAPVPRGPGAPRRPI